MNRFALILVAVLRVDVAMHEKKSLASYGPGMQFAADSLLSG
jgi:hypothetical protein